MENKSININGVHSTLFPVLTVNNETITLNNVSEKNENLFIHVSDYGDEYFDISLCYKDNKKNALAYTGWDIIHISELDEKIKLLSEITNITIVEKEKI